MNIIMNALFKNIPWYFRDVIMYRKKFGCFPNLSNPQTFNEKILKRKRTECFDNKLYTNLADKYKVRNYVSTLIGSRYLIPLIDVYSDASSLKNNIFKINKSVIKPNHGSGMVIFMEDYPTYEKACQTLREVNKWMRIDFSKVACEYHYRHIKRKIIIEKMIGDINNPPTDYKFHIFKKRDSIFFVLQIIERKYGKKPIFTTYINNFDAPCKGFYSISKENIEIARKALDESVSLMNILEYARMDWLVHNNELYFSEITLTPAAGYVTGLGKELDLLMGQQWDLPQKI
ncbi:ATP-grasp fold amidoligase family protein [Brenneria populi subsp. brevivirga]|uniref:ATP-grasp fold amidoligase family protein n=1 Tax=Brenneria populi TaxID=1505588 RepID=UPI002E1740DC|nr:ATP-grasp fold amidoligase family protein [Brenneria populi subsp. brevivirga]